MNKQKLMNERKQIKLNKETISVEKYDAFVSINECKTCVFD